MDNNTTARLVDLHNCMNDMSAKLNSAYEGFKHIYELLFEGCNPAPDYERDYNHIYQLYWLYFDALHQFVSEYAQLMGEGDSCYLRYENEHFQELSAVSKWFNARPIGSCTQ